MQNKKPVVGYDKQGAASYDHQRAKLAPIKNTLHLLMQMVFSKLPENARVLIVGAGTGAELIYLAEVFPNWNFIAVDPSASMLEICRQQADKAGIKSRCSFHLGYLDTLPESDAFDAATCILVSHFLVDIKARGTFFRQIAARLRPDAYLVNADLASDMTSPEYNNLLEVWIQAHEYAKMPVNPGAFGRDIAMLPLRDIEQIIASNGFELPVLFFQSLLIHAWYSRLKSEP